MVLCDILSQKAEEWLWWGKLVQKQTPGCRWVSHSSAGGALGCQQCPRAHSPHPALCCGRQNLSTAFFKSASTLHPLILCNVGYPFCSPPILILVLLFRFYFLSMCKKSSPSTAKPPSDRASIPPHRHTSSSTAPPKSPSSPASTSKRVTPRPASTGTHETKAKVRKWDVREAKLPWRTA